MPKKITAAVALPASIWKAKCGVLAATTRGHALFLQHRTKPGARDAVEQVWQKHMQPAIEANAGHELYVYSFASEPDRIAPSRSMAAPRRLRPS